MASERAAQGASPSPTGSGPSVTTIPDSEVTEAGRALVLSSDLVFLSTRFSTADSTLHAIDLDTRETRWTADDLYAHCQPVLLDDGIAVKLGEHETNPQGMALLSLDDGSALATIEKDTGGFVRRCNAMDGRGDVLVVREHVRVNAFRVTPDGFDLLWSDSGGGFERREIMVIDDSLVSVGTDGEDGIIAVLDLETGDERSEERIPGVGRPTIHRVGDASIAVTFEDSEGDDQSALTLVDLRGGRGDLRWTRRIGADDPPLPGLLVRNDDLLVGWSRHADGDGLIAYTVTDGDLAWTHTASSFTNNGILALIDGLVAIAPFGGDWIELVDVDGETVRSLDGEDGWGHPDIFGVVDDTLIVAGNGQGGAYLTFIDL